MPFISHSTLRCLVPRKQQVCDSRNLEILFKVISSWKPSLASAPNSYEAPVLTLPEPAHWTEGFSATTSWGNICFPIGCTWQLPETKRGLQ